MKLGYVVVAVIAVIITIFALQNTDPATVRFLVWRVEAVPVAGLVLASLIAGLLIAGLPLAIKMGVWRSRARSLEARANAAVGERDRQTPRTPPQS
jgi:uncharacterized integral membrane protein